MIPGVDDGAPDLETAAAMVRAAADDGCRALVATPHVRHGMFWNEDVEELRRRFETLRTAVEGLLDLHFGAEITVRHDSLDEILELPGGPLPRLAGSRYVLLELEPLPVGPDPSEVVHELVVQGVVPVLAHPERIPWLARSAGTVERLVSQGALLQLTGDSVSGEFGRKLRVLCRQWIGEGLVSFVSSDAHDLRKRPPGLSAAHREIAKHHGEAVADLLTVHHPAAVLADRPLSAPPPPPTGPSE